MDAPTFYRWNLSLREIFYEDLEEVEPADLKKTPAGGESILSLIRLMVETEWVWLHCVCRGREVSFLDEASFLDLGHAVRKSDEVEEATLDWFRRLSENDWERVQEHQWDLDGPALRFTREQAVFHVVTHEFHRRGQCGLLLMALGYEPAYVSFF